MDDYTTVARLKADVGNFISGFKSAQAEYDKFNSAMRSSSMSSTDALAGSSKVISTAMKAGAVAVTGLGVAAIKTGMDFEYHMDRVGAISGATKGDLKAMNDQAVQLGADTAFSAKEAAQGMESLSSAGFTAKETMAAMPGVLDLAAVSGGDVAGASENAATALRGFGLEASDAGHVADVFARAAADTNAEASDMGEALKMVAPQAHAAGISLEETAAAVGILSDSGIKGSQAGSNLAMAMTKLQNPSKEAADAMKEIGYTAYDSSGKMKPLATQVSELKSKMAGMTDQQKQYYLSQIYGVEGGRAMNVLLAAQSGKLEDLTASLKNSDGAAAEMASQMQDNLKSSVEQFGGSLESLAIVVSSTFGDVLRGGVDMATDAVGDLTNYIKENEGQIRSFANGVADGIGKLTEHAPSLEQVGNALEIVVPPLLALSAFKGIGAAGATTIKLLETMQADLTLVKTGLDMTKVAASKAGTIMNLAFVKPVKGAKDLVLNIKDIPSVLNSAKGKASSFGTALVGVFKDPKTAVLNLSNSFSSLGTKLGGLSGTISTTVTSGLTPMLTTMGMNTGAATGLASALGALLPIALGIAAVAAAIYAAWDSNFGNIRGVVESAWGGIKGIFSSMQPSIDAIKDALQPIGGLVKDIFAIAGVGIITALVGASIALATALRIVVDALAAIAQTAQAAFYGMKGLLEKMIPGGKDGSESMDKAAKSISGAKDSIKDMGTAFKDAWDTGSDAFGQFGDAAEGTKKSAEVASVSAKDVSKSVKQLKTDVEASKADFAELINTEGVSEKSKKFLTDVSETLTEYQQNSEKAAEEYSKAMTAADKKTGDDRIKATNEANAGLATATKTNGQNLINISSDLDRQLKEKRFSDGTAMTADQVKILTDQNLQVKAKLLEQNELYTQAQLSRVQNGEKLNQQERQATITTMQSNYELQSQQIKTGEQKVSDLKKQIQQAKDNTTKAQLQQELAQTEAHNQQLLGKQTTFGQQMNLVIANGQQLTYTTWSAGLNQLNGVTKEQLGQMYVSFVQMNTSTSEQMQAFALTLQKSGIKGTGDLVKALQDGKLTAQEATAAMKAGGEAGLAELPASMFKKGDEGKNSFITALKTGDFKGAGEFLATESAKGADQKEKHKDSGSKNSDGYSDGVDSKKDKAKKSGESVANAGVDGTKSKKSDYKEAGSSSANSYASGVESGKSEASSAGEALANSAKSSAEGVSFDSVGSQMAEGVAQGIRANTGSAVSAMASLVAQVNEEARKKADIHSPSRLLRDQVGKYLSLGVAQGILDYATTATSAMGNTISDLVQQASKTDLAAGISNQINDLANRSINSIPKISSSFSHMLDGGGGNQPIIVGSDQPIYVMLDGKVIAETTAPFISDIQQKQLMKTNIGKGRR
ncbi:phage tail tape measure protein [Enterococcus avium]|uniref:phage tail tape measure protein n=1 Tax=Enterococcus avium TaxID=33945 RepID=UPI0032E4B646